MPCLFWLPHRRTRHVLLPAPEGTPNLHGQHFRWHLCEEARSGAGSRQVAASAPSMQRALHFRGDSSWRSQSQAHTDSCLQGTSAKSGGRSGGADFKSSSSTATAAALLPYCKMTRHLADQWLIKNQLLETSRFRKSTSTNAQTLTTSSKCFRKARPSPLNSRLPCWDGGHRMSSRACTVLQPRSE